MMTFLAWFNANDYKNVFNIKPKIALNGKIAINIVNENLYNDSE